MACSCCGVWRVSGISTSRARWRKRAKINPEISIAHDYTTSQYPHMPKAKSDRKNIVITAKERHLLDRLQRMYGASHSASIRNAILSYANVMLNRK